MVNIQAAWPLNYSRDQCAPKDHYGLCLKSDDYLIDLDIRTHPLFILPRRKVPLLKQANKMFIYGGGSLFHASVDNRSCRRRHNEGGKMDLPIINYSGDSCKGGRRGRLKHFWCTIFCYSAVWASKASPHTTHRFYSPLCVVYNGRQDFLIEEKGTVCTVFLFSPQLHYTQRIFIPRVCLVCRIS